MMQATHVEWNPGLQWPKQQTTKRLFSTANWT